MNYKLLKLNIKIAWFRIFGSFKKINKINHFTSNDLTNSNILIIFPFEERLIRESMKSISKIISSNENNNLKLSFIINKSNSYKINFYKIKIISMDMKKNGSIVNLNEILNELKSQNFDIIIDLNINFKLEIAILINKLTSRYKLGFVSKYSDLFYNIQLIWEKNKDSRFKPIENILG